MKQLSLIKSWLRKNKTEWFFVVEDVDPDNECLARLEAVFPIGCGRLLITSQSRLSQLDEMKFSPQRIPVETLTTAECVEILEKMNLFSRKTGGHPVMQLLERIVGRNTEIEEEKKEAKEKKRPPDAAKIARLNDENKTDQDAAEAKTKEDCESDGKVPT